MTALERTKAGVGSHWSYERDGRWVTGVTVDLVDARGESGVFTVDELRELLAWLEAEGWRGIRVHATDGYDSLGPRIHVNGIRDATPEEVARVRAELDRRAQQAAENDRKTWKALVERYGPRGPPL